MLEGLNYTVISFKILKIGKLMMVFIHMINKTFIKHILIYGITISMLIFILKWVQWKYLILDNALDIYVGFIALFFTALGIWVASQIMKTKTETIIVEKEITIAQTKEFIQNEAEIRKRKLSKREVEVLHLLAKGYSNTDIGQEIHLSVSTIKTHVSGLLSKLEVKNRTQAVQKAQQLNIIDTFNR